jgi:hypothetical protein
VTRVWQHHRSPNFKFDQGFAERDQVFSVQTEFKVHEIDILNPNWRFTYRLLHSQSDPGFLPETGAVHAQIAEVAAVRASPGSFQNGKVFPHELIAVSIHLQQMVGGVGELVQINGMVPGRRLDQRFVLR